MKIKHVDEATGALKLAIIGAGVFLVHYGVKKFRKRLFYRNARRRVKLLSPVPR